MGQTVQQKRQQTGLTLRGGIALGVVLLCGVLMGRVSLGADLRPFGAAYAAAVFMNEKRVNPYVALAGVLLSFCTSLERMENIPYHFTVVIFLSAVLIVGNFAGVRRVYLTVAVGASAAYLTAAFAFKRFTLAGMLYSLIELCLTVITAYMMNVVIKLLIRRRKMVLTDAELVSLGFSSVLVISGVGVIQVGGVYLSAVAAAGAAMTAAYLGGSAVGAAIGLAVGAAAVMGGSDMAFLLSFSVSALVSGIFNRFSRYIYAIGFVFVALLAGYYLGGKEPEPAFLITAALGAGVFLLLPKKFLGHLAQYVNANLLRISEQKLSRERFSALTVGRLKEISGVFRNASKVFSGMAERREEGISYAIARIPAVACEKCVFYSSCWDKDFEQTYYLMQKLYAKFGKNGKIYEKDLGQAFLRQCIHPGTVIAAARDTFREYDINRKWENKIMESRGVLKEQMQGIAGVIDGLAREVRADFDIRADMENDIRRQLDEEGVAAREVVAQITGKNLFVSVSARSKETPEKLEPRIRRAVSAASGRRMSRIREMDRLTGDGYVFTYEQAKKIGLVTGVAACPKEGAGISGDSYTVKALRDGRYMMLISDGMGSGEKAAKESRAVVSLMEDFYGAGFEDSVIINSVNKLMLLGGSEEMFSTIDLSMVNMQTGMLHCTKIGAPHSYVIRGGNIRKIAAGSLPFGILEEMRPAVYRTELEPGDVIVMFSDGVADAEGEEEALRSQLANVTAGRNVQEIAENLLALAITLRDGKKDDMTVVISRVTKG